MGRIIIETPRLILREFDPEDLSGLYCLYEETNTSYIDPLDEDRAIELEKLKSYIKYVYGFYGVGLWATCLKENGRLIGRCGIQVAFLEGEAEGDYEIGYMISGKYAGTGYGTEVLEALIHYADEELDAKRVILQIHSKNLESLHLAEKMGFKHIERDKSDLSELFLFVRKL